MPIPMKMRSRDMVGKKITTAERISTEYCGVDVPAGTVLAVEKSGRGFTLGSPEPCPCCGVSVRLDFIARRRTFLPDDPDAPPLESAAFWENRADRNDHTWCQCSNCGFLVENYRAVKQGISSNDYVGVLWKFCPKCGKRMAIRNASGKAVL